MGGLCESGGGRKSEADDSIMAEAGAEDADADKDADADADDAFSSDGSILFFQRSPRLKR